MKTLFATFLLSLSLALLPTPGGANASAPPPDPQRTQQQLQPAQQLTAVSPLACDPILPAQNAITTDVCLNSDNRYRTVFSLTNYDPQEGVSAWLVDAAGISFASYSGHVPRDECPLGGGSVSVGNIGRCRVWKIDAYGNAVGAELDAAALYPGYWTLVLQGAKQGHYSLIHFQVLPPRPARNDRCADLLPPTRAILSPACGDRGDVFKIVGQGFTPGQRVAFYVTSPDGITEPLVNYHVKTETADTAGNATAIAFFPNSYLKGDYLITVDAGDGNRAAGYLRLR